MYEFDIPNMTCGHCKGTVEKAIRSADPSATATIDLMSRKAMVQTDLDPSVIGKAIEQAGYSVTVSAYGQANRRSVPESAGVA